MTAPRIPRHRPLWPARAGAAPTTFGAQAAQQGTRCRHGWQHERIDVALPAWLVLAALLLGLALCGCGGGSSDDDDDGIVQNRPIPCDARPELCR